LEGGINRLEFLGLAIFIADEAKNTGDAAHRRGFLTLPDLTVSQSVGETNGSGTKLVCISNC